MTFSYHRSLGPIVGMVLALALVETLVLHLVAIAFWGWKVALVLGLLDVSLVAALARLLHSFRRAPISLVDGVLTLRTGFRMAVSLPVATISGLRDRWSERDLKHAGVLNMALATWPNVVLDLREPVHRRGKTILSIAHCVDDLAGFRTAILEAIGADPA